MSALTGTGKLLRLILRRDRVLMPLWVLPLGVIPVSYVASINELFPTQAQLSQYADVSAHNAAFVALYGPLNGATVGELVAWRAGFIPVMVGLFSILTVIRHTRTEEEAGRRELLSATVLGRHAGLAAALVATLCANLVLGAVLALSMTGQGLPADGALAMGAEFAAAGWVFAGIAAVTAQLTSGAGSARGIAIAVLGAAYVLRVAGDIDAMTGGGLSWLSRLSPIGWAQRIDAFGAGQQWWPAALAVAATVALVWAAVTLSGRRDLDAGLLPARLGPAAAAPGLRSPLALAWRLHRGMLAGWAAGFAVLGLVLGYLAAGFGDLVRDSPEMQEIMGRLGGVPGLVDAYLSGIMGLFGLIAAGYAIQATLRARTEESGGRAEPVLGAAVGRIRWTGSHLVFSLLGPAVALAAAGLAMGLIHGLNTGDVGRELPRLLAGTMVQLPAVWVLAAIALALYGLLPKIATVSWGALVICLLTGMVGTAMGLDEWVLDVSPFTHLPRLPGGEVHVAPLAWLCGIAVGLGAAGLAALRRRDIPVA